MQKYHCRNKIKVSYKLIHRFEQIIIYKKCNVNCIFCNEYEGTALILALYSVTLWCKVQNFYK